MTADETRKYEMLVRVHEFGDAQGDLFPKSTVAAKTFADVGKAVDDLRQHAVSKMSATRDAARTRAAARAALYDRLVAMDHTARVIASDTSGLEGKFHLPATRGDSALITAGRQFAQDAEGFAAQFIARAMPKTFVKDLLGLVEALEAAIAARQAELADRAAARAQITDALGNGMAAVEALDAMVTNHLHGDAARLAVWATARRIDHRRLGKPRGKRGKAQPPAPAPTPLPAPTPAPAAPPIAASPVANVPSIDQKVA